jgi:hypothetical protein
MEHLAESCVVYDGLPISSGSVHGLGRVSARDALDRWLIFLNACTDPSPVKCWFDFPVTPGLTVDPHVVQLVEREFPRGTDKHIVPTGRVDDAIALFQSFEPLPTNKWGMAPVWLWFTTEIQLRSPTGGTWPAQDSKLFNEFVTPTGITLGRSRTRLVLQAKKGMGLALSIPLASDGDLEGVVPWLQASLPFKLSAKQWTRWTLTKNGVSYRGRKFVPAKLA